MDRIWAAMMPVVLAGVFGISNWKADSEKARVEFSVKGLFGTVHGNFKGLKSTIRFDPIDPGSGQISASVDATTVSTGIGLRNHHVREEEQFLNAEKYPTIGYRSRKIGRTGNGFIAEGELTIKDVTRPVAIPFNFQPSGTNAGVFKGQFTINRLDYHIGKPGGSIGEQIAIQLEIPVTKE